MASFSYLIKNRAKFSLSSKRFYTAWAKRLLLLPEIIKRNYRRWRMIRKGALIHQTAEIGVFNIGGDLKNLTIGSNSFIGRVNIALHDKVKIGNNVCINDGVHILTASHNIQDPCWPHIKSPVIIDDYAWVATNAVVLPGVHIGVGAVIGAGAVVSRNVAPYEIMVGNPAKPTSRKRTQNLQYNPCSFLAGNLAWIKG
ncbi:acyltransferase [Mucilaginibacter sp. KACC 22063]|uniref:acyltransferase n=1 Tax=Mucilaginibacter sp. KACC 22063 TaxID=3025666 RepID=UPI00236642BE|nr:acyltransferase [Mucilaginibacter sp. KACC 22063]WDF54461.1 acyltransferase [Mucilaginibacter sp. KACC 22063]